MEDASLEALAAMSEELARHGVTSFCPTVMARPIEGLPPILDMIRAGQRQGLPGAYVHGARLEGPYLSPLKKGAQKESSQQAGCRGILSTVESVSRPD